MQYTRFVNLCSANYRRSIQVAQAGEASKIGRMAGKENIYNLDLDKNAANYLPLTPLGFLERSADVYPERISVIHGGIRYTWRETYARCRKLAHALSKRGIGVGQTVSLMAPNVPAHLEVYFGVPM